MLLFPLMLLMSSPVKAGLILLVSTIIMVITWNLPLQALVVTLVYISGLLIMLLYLTSFSSYVIHTTSWWWLFPSIMILPIPMLGPTLLYPSNFNMMVIYDSPWILSVLVILILLVVVLIILSSLLASSLAFRSLS